MNRVASRNDQEGLSEGRAGPRLFKRHAPLSPAMGGVKRQAAERSSITSQRQIQVGQQGPSGSSRQVRADHFARPGF